MQLPNKKSMETAALLNGFQAMWWMPCLVGGGSERGVVAGKAFMTSFLLLSTTGHLCQNNLETTTASIKIKYSKKDEA